MSYAWAGDYGLLVEIEKTIQYLATTGETHIIPTKLDNIDPDVLVNGTTQTWVSVLQARMIDKKRNRAVVSGFRKGVSNNFRECLQPRYYEQLYEPVLKYKRIMLRGNVTPFESKWVMHMGATFCFLGVTHGAGTLFLLINTHLVVTTNDYTVCK